MGEVYSFTAEMLVIHTSTNNIVRTQPSAAAITTSLARADPRLKDNYPDSNIVAIDTTLRDENQPENRIKLMISTNRPSELARPIK